MKPKVVDSIEDRLRAIDRDCMIWADTVHYRERPIVVERCQGDLVWDCRGRVYIDTQMWHSSCNFGYRNPEIESALERQLRARPQISSDFLHPEKLWLAEEVVEAIRHRTGVRGRVSFNVGGSLVVEDALKVARANTGRNRVGVFMGGYHGRSLGTLPLSSSHRYRQGFGHFGDRAVMFPFGDCRNCFYELTPDTCERYCAHMIAKSFENEFYGLATETDAEIGAFVLECCQGRGYATPPADFFRRFIPQLRERGVLIVDDEIQVGMFRTGKLFAFEHFDFVPDMITLSKSFTNGLSPISLLWAREDLVPTDRYGPGRAHSNFSNHPLGTAAALATWRYMMGRNYAETVPQKGAYLLKHLERLRDKHAIVSRVEGLGLLLSLSLCRPDGRPWDNGAHLAATLAQENDFDWRGEPYRMILCSGGYRSEVIKLAPCLDITIEEMDRLAGVLDQALELLAAQADRLGDGTT